MRNQLAVFWQVDSDDRPVELPRLLDTEILWSPFEDIVPRITKEEREAEAAFKRWACHQMAVASIMLTICEDSCNKHFFEH